jgi:cytochrome c556
MKVGYRLGAALVAGMTAMGLGCAQEQAPQQTAQPTQQPQQQASQQTQQQTPDGAAALSGPGWTGLTEPAEVIEARRGLMDELERLIKPIDLYTIGEPADPEELRSAAVTISRMLLAVPHLFPPTTNLYDPNALDPQTATLPVLWRTFDTFFELSEAAEMAATSMTTVDDPEALRAAARSLRASCDACHAIYLRAYEAPTVKPEDLEFDFESVLPQN